MSALKRDALDRRLAGAGLVRPQTLTLSITNQCNMICRHCWPSCGSSSEASSVPQKVLQRLIRETVELGVKKLILTGGEPLLHPDWFAILAFACRQRGFEEVCLQTNGTLLTEAVVSDLCSMVASGLSIQVSLEGAHAATHDNVRGPGNFDLILKGLKRLNHAGLGRQTYVAFTEMRHNCGDIPQLLKLAERLKLGRVVAGALVQGGRAALNDHLALPRPEQYKELLNHYHTDKRFRERYSKLAKIAAIEWFKGHDTPSQRVCTCIANPLITADGIIYPCALFQHPDYAIANVHALSLPQAISDGLPLWAELPKISRRRSERLKACQNCPGFRHCAGGCMGRAYAAFGKLMAREDRCQLRKVVYGLFG